VRGRVDAHFVDLGEKELKNIARPVRVFAVGTNIESEAASAPPNTASGAPHLSLLVLPFANLSSDPEQEYFVDGVTDSLTTDLSRLHGSLVIGRNTAFTYKGKPVDLKRIGRELNVRYVLEGSIQRSGQRIRVNVQLIDAESGSHLWAERFDKPVADLFDLQDEIVARLARVLAAKIAAAEARRAERAQNPDALDHYFRGWAWIYKGTTPDNLNRARDFFDRALKIDPDNVEALSSAAWVDVIFAKNFMPDDSPARLAAAEAAVTKALSLAPGHAIPHETMGMVYIYTNRADRGIEQFERALALNRNLPGAHGQIGIAKLFLGRPEEVERHMLATLRLSPHDTFAYVCLMYLGLANLVLARDDEAVVWLRQSIEANRNNPRAHFLLAAAFAYLGRFEEARVA
jgi:TolB-like protein/Flp pilus assembly protein TadD